MLKKVTIYFGLVLLSLIMIAAMLTYLLPHCGWRLDAVSAGRLDPVIYDDSLVVVRPVSPETIQVNDLIAFYPVDRVPVTIDDYAIGTIRQIESPLSFEARGVNNADVVSYFILPENVIGKVLLIAGGWQHVHNFIQSTAGLLVCLIIPGLIIISFSALIIRRELKKFKIVSVGETVD